MQIPGGTLTAVEGKRDSSTHPQMGRLPLGGGKNAAGRLALILFLKDAQVLCLQFRAPRFGGFCRD